MQLIDTGQFCFYYRPRVSLQMRQVVGVDLRFRREADAENADIAICSNLSDEDIAHAWQWKMSRLGDAFDFLGELKDAHSFQHGNLLPFVSLVLSERQLHTDAWVSQFLEALKAVRIPGERVEIDVRPCAGESGREPDSSLVQWSFDMARNVGARLALGNFPHGAGLRYLSQFRFDKVKIADVILPRLEDAVSVWSRGREILKGMVGVIHASGAEAVLEGGSEEMYFKFFHEIPITEWQSGHGAKAEELEGLLARILEMNFREGLHESCVIDGYTSPPGIAARWR